MARRVNIPVRVESATRDTTPKFRMADGRDNSPGWTIRVRQGDGEPVDSKELLKGYGYEPGHYAILDDEDFRQVALQTARTIDIMDFVDESEIDTRYFEKPYYLEVQRGGEKAYALLRKAMREMGKVAERLRPAVDARPPRRRRRPLGRVSNRCERSARGRRASVNSLSCAREFSSKSSRRTRDVRVVRNADLT